MLEIIKCQNDNDCEKSIKLYNNKYTITIVVF